MGGSGVGGVLSLTGMVSAGGGVMGGGGAERAELGGGLGEGDMPTGKCLRRLGGGMKEFETPAWVCARVGGAVGGCS